MTYIILVMKMVSKTKFLENVYLIRNPKAARSKPWVAKVKLEENEIEFQRYTNVISAFKGRVCEAEYEFENNCFYIILRDESSHNDSFQGYSLYITRECTLERIALITFENRVLQFNACDDDLLKELKNTYRNMKNGRKVINTLIQVAKYYAQREGIAEISKDELILNEIKAIAEKYDVSIEYIISCLAKEKEART